MLQKLKNVYHLINAVAANVIYGFPSKKLTVIGVTGTDGKTTTVSLIYHILSSTGYNASMISSVGAVIGGKNYDVGFHVTTPSTWHLQKFIKKISEKSIGKENSYLVLETTSHALDQYRVWGIKYDIGVLTNITNEHLDYHKTYENYVKTKSKLLKNSRIAIVNKDDKSFNLISRDINKSKLITYGMKSDSDVNIKSHPIKTNMIGVHNKYNILAAVGVCRELGIDNKKIQKAINSFKAPIGRGEIVYPSADSKSTLQAGSGQHDDFTVMIDFAHTPNSFEQILSSIKPGIKGRLIHIFGSAGLRDYKKRPEMGKISSKYSNIIILTSEDPRSESVEKIMKEIEKGIFNFQSFDRLRIDPEESRTGQFSIFNKSFKFQNKKKYLFKIPDRKEAIRSAIKMAKKGDFILITGKAHEKSMNYGSGEEPWDEFETVRIALSLRANPA